MKKSILFATIATIVLLTISVHGAKNAAGGEKRAGGEKLVCKSSEGIKNGACAACEGNAARCVTDPTDAKKLVVKTCKEGFFQKSKTACEACVAGCARCRGAELRDCDIPKKG
jgi:hypothetical protein